MDNRSQANRTLTAQEAVDRFNEAFGRHDVEAIMAAMTTDCVFENTSPVPAGTRYEGAAAVRAFWEDFFRASPHARFEIEDQFACGDRVVVNWTYHWLDAARQPGSVRGVDLFRVRDGKVAEKLSYVKG